MIKNAVKVKITSEDKEKGGEVKVIDKVSMHFDCYKAFCQQDMAELRALDHNNTEYYNSFGKPASFEVPSFGPVPE